MNKFKLKFIDKDKKCWQIDEQGLDFFISAYHKPNDKQRLPLVVKSILSDYGCALHRKWEEDFYCKCMH
jgi:hypothetical protein